MNFSMGLAHRRDSEVENRSAESEGLRFDSSWRLRTFSLSHARDKTKNIFIHFFTELITYFLTYSIYKGLIIPLLFSIFILILVCELHPTALSVHRIHRIRCTPKKKQLELNHLSVICVPSCLKIRFFKNQI